MLRKFLVSVPLALLAGACASPFIYDLESDKVMVQSQSDDAATMHTADEGCGIHGRTAVGPLSHRCLDGYCINKVYLFACRDSGKNVVGRTQ
jgi:hypothetical protein